MDYFEYYKKVENFTDLLYTNIMFFEGKMSSTYYYFSKWGEGEDQNNHAIISTDNLLELTKKYRLFTINGQSSYTFTNDNVIKMTIRKLISINKEITEYNKEHNFIYNIFSGFFDNYIIGLNLLKNRTYKILEKEENKVTIQRSFVEFFIEDITYDSIKNKLDDSRIWYCILTPNKKIITNMPRRKVCLTNDHTIFTVDDSWRDFEKSPYENINKILDRLYLCHVCCREFSTPYTADEIMIEIMKK